MWDLLERYFDRLDDLRRFLAVANAIESSASISWSQAEREARGSAIVCSMAELEALVVGVLCYANEEINASGTLLSGLRPSLRPLAAHRELNSLGSLNDARKVWPKRETVTCLNESQKPCDLPVHGRGSREPQPPLDGRTLKPHHLQRIATVYGMETRELIHTAEALSLKKLSDARNDIAHGNMPFHDVFSRAGFRSIEIRTDLDAFDEIGHRVVSAFDTYLSSSNYIA